MSCVSMLCWESSSEGAYAIENSHWICAVLGSPEPRNHYHMTYPYMVCFLYIIFFNIFVDKKTITKNGWILPKLTHVVSMPDMDCLVCSYGMSGALPLDYFVIVMFNLVCNL